MTSTEDIPPPDSFNWQTATVEDGFTIRYIDEVPPIEPLKTLLLLHGWPGSAYSWVRQIGPWRSRGWRVIAIDSVGYGGTVRTVYHVPNHCVLYCWLTLTAMNEG